jgi:pilus assembly protein CpaF
MVESELNKLLSIEGLSDLTFNGHSFAFANVDGNWRKVPSPFPSEESLLEFASNLATVARRRLDFGCPFADIAVGSLRYHLALPITGGRFHMSIRKHQSNHLGLLELLENPTRWLTQLTEIVYSKANFLISGGTGSGKTTLLRSMIELDQNQRVITAEDVAELELSMPNQVSLHTRQANSEGAGQIDLQRLVLESLRMKPDRIVVGEVRGAELVPMLQALNSGHRGSATTIHANRAEDVPARLVGIGLLGGLSPATTSHLAASAFDYVISLTQRTKSISIGSIARLELTRESRLVTRIE